MIVGFHCGFSGRTVADGAVGRHSPKSVSNAVTYKPPPCCEASIHANSRRQSGRRRRLVSRAAMKDRKMPQPVIVNMVFHGSFGEDKSRMPKTIAPQRKKTTASIRRKSRLKRANHNLRRSFLAVFSKVVFFKRLNGDGVAAMKCGHAKLQLII